MSRIVLDASALLAILNRESGSEGLTPELLSEATSSTVNLAEVQTALVRQGANPEEAWEDALSPIREATPFTSDHAKIAGGLVSQTRVWDLSLGDRACLALGLALRLPVYTADKLWKHLSIGIKIHVIR